MFNRKEYMKKWHKDYYIKNKEHLKKYYKKWAKENKKHRKEYRKQRRKDNPNYEKQFYQNNKEHHKELNRKWMKEKRRTDLKYNLNNKMGHYIWDSIRKYKSGRHWEDLVGYKLADLIKRLKKTMPKGYTWQDYLEAKLHIDHIIPISVLNFDSPDQIDFKRCWALENLQLLPAKENLIKHNKLFRPFQPALKLKGKN